jgi:hypothetical protein
METNTKNYNKHLYRASIVFFIVFSLFFGIFWYCSYNNIKSLKVQVQEKLINRQNSKEFEPFQIDYKKLNSRQVIINPKEIDKINRHINSLTEEVYKESNRAESIIDKDLDRLNLYMAIGIGFMTILGIFVPVLVNVLSYQDIKDKQKVIDFDFQKLKGEYEVIKEPIKQAIIDSQKALESSEKVKNIEKSVENIEKNMDKSFPQVSTLILQNAIGRYFNIAPLILTNLVREKDATYYIELLETIRCGFQECRDNDKHTISNDIFLQSTIKDFARYIRNPGSTSSTLDKKVTNEFYVLYSILTGFLKATNTQEELESYTAIDNKLGEIIELIKKSHAKTEPATQTS